jgi:hypothetical protein
MQFKVYWDDNARTILRWDQQGDFSIEDFRQTYAYSHQVVAANNAPFDVIINGEGGRMPRFPISEIQNAFRNASPHHGMTIFVTTEPFARAMLGVLQKTGLPITKRIAFVKTVDEARTLIATRRAALR